MPLPFVASLLIGIAFQVIGYYLMPKPKQPRPASLEDFKEPTAEAGRPIPVVFGSITIQSPNNLGHWDKEVVIRHVKSPKK